MPTELQTPSPFPIPLSANDRAIVLARIEAFPLEIKGDDTDRLIGYVELAQQPVDDRYMPLGRGAAAVAASEPDADALAAKLPDLIKAAQRMTALSAWPMVAGIDSEADRQPRRRMIDPLASALARFVRREAGAIHMHRTRAVRRAIETLATFADVPAPSKAGAPYDRRGASGLVRAACLYAYENDFFQSDWPGPGSAADTPTRTTELIVKTAAAFGIAATHSELRTNLRNYAVELRAMGRTNPAEEDLYGKSFDNSPRQRPRAR